jgi:hypothetical protein
MRRWFECPNIQVIPEQRSPRPVRENRTRMSPQLKWRESRQHEHLQRHRNLPSSSSRARFGAGPRAQGKNTRLLNSPRFRSIANRRLSLFERLPSQPVIGAKKRPSIAPLNSMNDQDFNRLSNFLTRFSKHEKTPQYK